VVVTSPPAKEESGNVTWIDPMTTRKRRSTRFAVCIDNSEYPASLERHKVYRVLPDKEAERDGDLRVIDESGEDYLYPADYFVLVDLPRDRVSVLKKSFARSLQHAN
jgi:hypothetical protein